MKTKKTVAATRWALKTRSGLFRKGYEFPAALYETKGEAQDDGCTGDRAVKVRTTIEIRET